MISRSQPVSFGALALILCLALPTGMLSLFSSTTTGEMVDLADRIVVGRVLSTQYIKSLERTIIAFKIDHAVVGTAPGNADSFAVEGQASLQMGDHAVVMMTLNPSEVLGYQLLRKTPQAPQYEVITPITGMVSEGLSDSGPVGLPAFEAAILARRGVSTPGNPGTPGIDDGPHLMTGIQPDRFEPNNDIASRTPVELPDPTMVTGMPTVVTGLTLTTGDVDYFSFDAAPLTVLYAETQESPMGAAPDTLLGLFDAVSGDLLDSDNDSGEGMLSALAAPLGAGGDYSVAVSGYPDEDFSGGDGVSTGFYELALELKLGSYLWNTNDQMAGFSPDGTFIEDFVGYKVIDGVDALYSGPTTSFDGWSLSYTLPTPPPGVTGLLDVFGGAGTFVLDPDFSFPSRLVRFSIGEFTDAAGTNPNGAGDSAVTVYPDVEPPSVGIIHDLTWSVDSATLNGIVNVMLNPDKGIEGIVFNRLIDINLFGEGPDTFTWVYDRQAKTRIFAVDKAAEIGSLPTRPSPGGPVTADLQAALVINHGSGGDIPNGRFVETHYPVAYTLVTGFATELDARAAAESNLMQRGLTAWVIATDADPDSGLYAAFGIGLSDP